MIEAWPAGYLAIPVSIAAALLAARFLQSRGWKLQPSNGRLESIDGLRGYLALGVSFEHFFIASRHRVNGEWPPPEDTLFANLGPAGVTCFFFITAMLFYPRARVMRSALDWTRLYVGRLFRLVPLYWLAALIVIVAAFGTTQWTLRVPASDNTVAVARWLGLGIFGAPPINGYADTQHTIAGVTWSLQYEWLFYAALPLIAWVARFVPQRAVRVAGLCAVLAVFAALPPIIKLDMSSRIASAFLLGMIAAELIEIPAVTRLLRAPLFSLLGLAALATALLVTPYYHPAQMLLLFVFFLPVACGNSYFGALRSTLSKMLGEVSYSVYLLHGFLLFCALSLAPQSWLMGGHPHWFVLPILTAVLVFVAAVAFRLVELPGIRLGKLAVAAIEKGQGKPVVALRPAGRS
jgi:peptidoglycan/LPS O-acetylase OafA/YrhL